MNFGLVLVLAAALSGWFCGGDSSEQKIRRDIETLKAEIGEIERSGRSNEGRIQELSTRLQRLQMQLSATAGDASPQRPGAALPVIKLAPIFQGPGSYNVVGRGDDSHAPATPQANDAARAWSPPGAASAARSAPAGELVTKGALIGSSQVLEELHRLLTSPDGHPLEVIHYGDSHTAASALADELRRGMSHTGLVSPGYVTHGLPMFWEAKVDVTGSWTRQNWLATHDTGSFGPLGIAYLTKNAGSEMGLRLEGGAVPREEIEVTAYYWNVPGALPFRLEAAGQTLATVRPLPAADETQTLGAATVTLPEGVTVLRLIVTGSAQRADQELRFFGFQVRYARADVEWDTLGVGGTTVLHPLQRGDDTIRQFLVRRDPELVVVWFGTNSVLEPKLDIAVYGQKYSAFLRQLRLIAPHAQCLAIGPPDLSRREKGCFPGKEPKHPALRGGKNLPRERLWRVCNPDRLLAKKGRQVVYPVEGVHDDAGWERYKEQCAYHTLPALTKLNDVQRQAALDNGCAYFDTFEYMGGNESMVQWACQEETQLGMFDFIHLTQSGYRKVARGVLEALGVSGQRKL